MKNQGIAITKPLQGYIVERIQGDTHIPPNTNIFCGKCGGSIGVTIKGQDFPFTWIDLEQNMRDTNIFVTGTQGVTCQHCQHVVSFQAKAMKFTSLENYRSWFPTNEDTQL